MKAQIKINCAALHYTHSNLVCRTMRGFYTQATSASQSSYWATTIKPYMLTMYSPPVVALQSCCLILHSSPVGYMRHRLPNPEAHGDPGHYYCPWTEGPVILFRDVTAYGMVRFFSASYSDGHYPGHSTNCIVTSADNSNFQLVRRWPKRLQGDVQGKVPALSRTGTVHFRWNRSGWAQVEDKKK